MIRDIIVAALGALIISELTDVSPWLALHLVRWAADRMYAADSGRAEIRREEWEALVRDDLPTRTSKLCFGLAFGCAALFCLVIRWAPKALAVVLRLIHRCVPSGETVQITITIVIVMVIWNLPGLYGLIAFGSLIVLFCCMVGIACVMEGRQSASAEQGGNLKPRGVAKTEPGHPTG